MVSLLIYDGSFEGFLTSVFVYYEFKLNDVDIQKENEFQESLFGESLKVITDNEKADRVWKKLKQKTEIVGCYQLYTSFLSEESGLENILLHAIKYILANEKNVASDYSNPHILKVNQLAKNVGREKHRMEGFVRFKLTKDNIYFANIEPDFNVLPLISKHFENRFADQQWVIYDVRRNYGLYYNLKKVEIVTLEFNDEFHPTKTSAEIFAPIELEFQQLWKDYFKSTNIESRKNMRLHVKLIPKRYWKYLSEKQ